MSVKLVRQAFELPHVNNVPRLILCYLSFYADNENVCIAKVKEIAARFDMSADSVRSHIRALEQKGLISTDRQYQRGEAVKFVILPKEEN